jgi:hypothetical protein
MYPASTTARESPLERAGRAFGGLSMRFYLAYPKSLGAGVSSGVSWLFIRVHSRAERCGVEIAQTRVNTGFMRNGAERCE